MARVDRTVDGSSVPLGKLLSGIGECRIPLFQRGYSWEYIHVHRLLTDEWQACIRERPPREVFLGSLVTQSSKQNDQYCNIIDGQQRLTTINLILIALRELFRLGGSGEGTKFFDERLLVAKVSKKFISGCCR